MQQFCSNSVVFKHNVQNSHQRSLWKKCRLLTPLLLTPYSGKVEREEEEEEREGGKKDEWVREKGKETGRGKKRGRRG